VPLVAKPNAGLPKIYDQLAVYDTPPRDFAAYTRQFIACGVALIGGCCGTTPEYIGMLSERIKHKKRNT
jgi:5-methyltetrahydrofolate--homocysteine methyltransferase